MSLKIDGNFPTWAWPGGYPIFYILADNAIICPDCANGKNGSLASEDNDDPQWKIIASDVHWGCEYIHCKHCNALIKSAYGE